ncbi:MFS transporter [Actinokineospora sp. HUAS TT18]|uniref:MFS transporter n=1 Tax=Actinokineospora sp. HUAS TT18 TaxID=3447451 RepID=UPI003F522998
MPESLWRLSRFRNLWLAQTVSLLGTQFTLVAFPLVALLLDADAADIGLLFAIEFVPILLLGLPAGAWVERLPLRAVLLVSDGARAAALLVVPIAWAAGVLTMPLLFAVAFVIGVGTLFFDVAQMSILPELLTDDQLADGNAKLEGSRSFSQLGGPTAGGFVVQWVSAPLAVLIDALSYALSFVFLLFVRDRARPKAVVAPQGLGKEIAEGVRFVRSHPVLAPLAVCDALANLGFAAVLAMQVFYGAEVLGLSAGAIGAVLAIGNLGGLVGAVASGPLSRRIAPGRLLIGSVVVFTAGAAMLPVATGFIGFGAGLFVAYFGVVVYNVTQVTLRQVLTPEHLMSRTNATLRFIEWGTLPVGAALGGFLAVPLGLRGVLWAAAAACALSLLPALVKPVRSLELPADEAPALEPQEAS